MSLSGERFRSIVRRTTPAGLRRQVRSLPHKWRMIRTYGGLRRAPIDAIRYLLFDRELDNFTYRLANSAELAVFLGEAFGTSAAKVSGYLAELEGDRDLSGEIERRLKGRPDRNRTMPFGRRLGWYAVARIVRPRLVVETGVHDGLGSTALLRALERNAEEGSVGELISFEIDPGAGWLIPEAMRSHHRIVLGDSLVQIPAILKHERVDMFIHDSDHRYEHEAAEFEAIADHLNGGAALISDNAHGCTAFADFCGREGYQFRFWREIPRNHFYPGAGIGLTVTPTTEPSGSA